MSGGVGEELELVPEPLHELHVIRPMLLEVPERVLEVEPTRLVPLDLEPGASECCGERLRREVSEVIRRPDEVAVLAQEQPLGAVQFGV